MSMSASPHTQARPRQGYDRASFCKTLRRCLPSQKIATLRATLRELRLALILQDNELDREAQATGPHPATKSVHLCQAELNRLSWPMVVGMRAMRHSKAWRV